jgi:hypoxanthine phosphoribosyltransferase
VLRGRGAASVELCTLLDKAVRRIVPLTPAYAGFDCPDRFVVGYGLDYRERYRHLPDILQVDDLEALRADPDVLIPLVRGRAAA